jgi:AcrR family transcriptional regulator
MPRRYVMQQRAEAQEATRQRIVSAAIEVRSARGGSRTLTEVAARAGVSRLTVYRHFPTDVELATACMLGFTRLHPPPDPSAWAAIQAPDARLRRGLADLYAWYADNEAMLTNSAVDQFADPALAEALAPMTVGFEAMHRILAAGWREAHGASSLLDAAIGHAMAFTTWLSLRRGQGLAEDETMALMAGLVETAAAS